MVLFGRKPNKGIYGSARFLQGQKRRRLISVNHAGLVVDGQRRLTLEKSYFHLAIIAPTGAGKTTRYIIPNVLRLEHSAVITDPSGEIFRKTAGYLQNLGYHIKVVDVSNLHRSLQYNPLHRANSYTQIEKISDILVRAAYPEGVGNNEFWNDGAKHLISLLIRCLQNQPEHYRNLHNVRYLLNQFGQDGRILEDLIIEADRTTKDEIKGFLAQDLKVILGAVSTAKGALKKFSDPELCQLTCKETLHFESIRRKKTALYIIVPEHEVKYYGFFLSILYQQIFSFCMEPAKDGQPHLPVMFLMDEFGNTGHIPGFSGLVTTLRKRQVSLSIVLQDVGQLHHTYGRAEASTILNNCGTRIFFPGLGVDTTRELEEILGRTTLKYSESGFHKSRTAESMREREVGRSLLTPDEIRTLPDDQALLLHTNKRPVLLRMRAFYQDRKLLTKSRIKPPLLSSKTDTCQLHYIPLSEK